MRAWNSFVQYRWTCEGPCRRLTMVSVVKRRGKRDIRLCETCYEDGFYKEEERDGGA